MNPSWEQLLGVVCAEQTAAIAEALRAALGRYPAAARRRLLLEPLDAGGGFAIQSAYPWLTTLFSGGDTVLLMPNCRAATSCGLTVTVSSRHGLALGCEGFPQTTLPLPLTKGDTAPTAALNHTLLLLGLLTLGASLADSPDQTEALAQSVEELWRRLEAGLGALQQSAAAVAEGWSSLDRVELVGDGADLGAAGHLAFLLSRFAGLLTTVSDSENWCHVNFYGHPPREIGLLLIAPPEAENNDLMEKVGCIAHILERPVAVVGGVVGRDGAGLSLPQAHWGGLELYPLVTPLIGGMLAEQLILYRKEAR